MPDGIAVDPSFAFCGPDIPSAIGLAIGLAIAYALINYTSTLLFKVEPSSTVTSLQRSTGNLLFARAPNAKRLYASDSGDGFAAANAP